MLRITGWSLLLGTAALIAGLILFYAPTADRDVPSVVFGPDSGKPLSGTADVVDGNLRVVLDKWGAGLITYSMNPVSAQDYPYLHIGIAESPRDLSVAFTWANVNDRKKVNGYRVENQSLASQWIATAELEGWSGDIDAVSLLITGAPGETVVIRDLSLHPVSPWRQLQAIYSDITAYNSWNRAAMNTYTGVTNVASFYPVPLAVALFFLSLLAYGAMVVLSRGKLRFNRINAALIFLACWIVLDAAWQHRLWHQLTETYHDFAGVEPQKRQSVGPDALLVGFASQVKPQVAANGRVFVASSDHYNGMRVAYYLYPVNVFWSLHYPELPYDEFLKQGDYIALVRPTAFQFNGKRGVLSAPDRADIPVKLVYSDAIGTLVRLK